MKEHLGSGYPKIKNNLRIMTRLDARTQKNFKGEKIDQINWNLTHKWPMHEQNAQAQKKLYNKIRSMPSKSSAAT